MFRYGTVRHTMLTSEVGYWTFSDTSQAALSVGWVQPRTSGPFRPRRVA